MVTVVAQTRPSASTTPAPASRLEERAAGGELVRRHVDFCVDAVFTRHDPS